MPDETKTDAGADQTPGLADVLATFKTELLGEIDKKINGTLKSQKSDFEKLLAKHQPKADLSPTTDSENPGSDDGGGTVKTKLPPEVNAELQTLRSQLKKLGDDTKNLSEERNNERTARLESERKAAIHEAMSKIQFRDDRARNTFFKSVERDIIRDDQGNLVARGESGDLPVPDYIQSAIDGLPGLVKSTGTGGSGAAAGAHGKKGVQMEDIRPGAKPEVLDEALREAYSKLQHV